MSESDDAMRQLQAAEASACQQSQTAEPGGAVFPCPLPHEEKALEVIVVGEDDQPLMDIAIELRKGSDQAMRSKTDSRGRVRFDGLPDGTTYQLRLIELDKETWDIIDDQALSDAEARSVARANWKQAAQKPNELTAEIIHVADQGDCVTSLAKQYGVLPDALWNYGPNAALKQLRAKSNVLYPDDELAIPPRRAKDVTVNVKHRYRIRRKGIPDMLRLRFLNCDEEPRVGIPYVLNIHTFSGEPAPPITGELDGAGYVIARVPPDAENGELVLGTGPDRETYTVDFGFVDPIDTFAGVQDRLANLGYYDCCDDDGDRHQATRGALAVMQLEQGLELTGKVEDASRAKLEEMHLS